MITVLVVIALKGQEQCTDFDKIRVAADAAAITQLSFSDLRKTLRMKYSILRESTVTNNRFTEFRNEVVACFIDGDRTPRKIKNSSGA